MNKNENGFSGLGTLLILIIVGIIGFTGWFVWHAKESADKNLAVSSSTTSIPRSKFTNQNTTAKLPDGWVWYQGDGFKFGYPGAYGQFSDKNAVQITGSIQDVLSSGQPTSAPFPGLSSAEIFILDKYDTSDATIQSRKYGPTVKLESGKWVVTQDNPSDPKPYKVGAIYDEVAATTKNTAMVYTFSSGDEGGIIYTLAFIAKGHLYTLQLPEFDTGTYASQASNDQNPYDQLSSELAENIIVE